MAMATKMEKKKVEREERKAVIESVLFVADNPTTPKKIAELFEGEISEEEAVELLGEIAEGYESRNLNVVEVAEGWRLQSRSDYAEWITKFFKMERGQRLGRAALEVLAIVAYRQPITRAEIDEIRGVDSGASLRGTVEKNLVKAMGRRKTPGRPMMYGTTKRFLEYFGLSKLSDLPTMEEFADELADALPRQAPQEALDFNYDETATAPDEDITETPNDESESTTEETEASVDTDDDGASVTAESHDEENTRDNED